MYNKTMLKRFLLSAMAYAYGYTDYDDILPIISNSDLRHFTEQIAEVKKKQTRTPKLVVDVGAGRGDLTASFLYDGVPCIAVDPSPGPAEIIPDTLKKWLGSTVTPHPVEDDATILCATWPRPQITPRFIKKRMYPALLEIVDVGLKPDTIVLCATIEHIPKEEFFMSLRLIDEIFKETGGLLIITSFVEYHPIADDLIWDHIHRIDDETYDNIEKVAPKLIFRRGSHLVVGW